MLHFARVVGVLSEDARLYQVHAERARFMIGTAVAEVATIGGKKHRRVVTAIRLSKRASAIQRHPVRRNGEMGDFCTSSSVRHIDVEHKIPCCGGKPDCCLCGGTGFRTDLQRALGYELKPIHNDDQWAFVPTGVRDRQPAAA